jgi:hypothetical protein
MLLIEALNSLIYTTLLIEALNSLIYTTLLIETLEQPHLYYATHRGFKQPHLYYATHRKLRYATHRSLETETTAIRIGRADHVTPLYPQKLALTSAKRGGRTIGIVRSRTKATELLVEALEQPLLYYATHRNHRTASFILCYLSKQ